MTLRIFDKADADGAVLALHGWLSAAEMGELAKAVAGTGPCVRIDLAQLAGVDTEGLRALRRLRGGGARFTGASPYIELLLERSAADDGER